MADGYRQPDDGMQEMKLKQTQSELMRTQLMVSSHQEEDLARAQNIKNNASMINEISRVNHEIAVEGSSKLSRIMIIYSFCDKELREDTKNHQEYKGGR